MQHIGKQLPAIELKQKPKNGINSERAEVVSRVCAFMNDGKAFKYWLGRTRKFTPGEIHGLMKQAMEGRNPAALFNFLLKKKLSTLTLDNVPKAGV